ncbi:class I SAM-dependent DNA methyltransferase [Nonomuraea sediminis]|uniref:class I SAM-dependent DNA methyltransferase n=1 Tax=Nonomuraea sediminis TaxID=2835864 RepID=UPI001BDC86AD|nr:class I SAM-dependent methyltransferase [Nonomuraea sediminis]
MTDFLDSTRTSYDTFADQYTALYRDELDRKPLSRAMLAAFAELADGPVADIGCGTGRVTAHLDGLGVEVFGIDLSPGMLAHARRDHPHLRFDEGSMLELDLPDESLGGVLAWYSIIHTPHERLPEVFAGFHRVLRPGGVVLLAFQVGDEPKHYAEAFGLTLDLTFWRSRPDDIATLLGKAGFTVQARMECQPAEDEHTPQAFLMARK